MRRHAAVILTLTILSACSSSKNTATNTDDPGKGASLQQKDCADPKWKETHLGVWYNVCRPNAALQ